MMSLGSQAGELRTIARNFRLAEYSDYAWTLAAEGLVLVAQLLLLKLAASQLGSSGFGEYMLARRGVSFLQPVLLLGMGVALPRFLGRGFAGQGFPHFGAAARVILASTLTAVILLNLLAGPLAFLLFGSRALSGLVPPLTLMLAGGSLHVLAYGYFRGRLRMRAANSLQIVNLGLLPLLAFVFFPASAASVLAATGLGWIVVSTLVLVFTPWREALVRQRDVSREMLVYGSQRVLGDFFHMGLLALPVILAAHSAGLEAAGRLAFAVALLSMVGSLFSPISIVLLPKASRLLAQRAFSELRAQVTSIVMTTAAISAAITLLAEAVAPALVGAYLGPAFLAAALPVRIVLVGAVPFALYCVLRGLVDAYHDTAVNAINNLIALAVLGVIGALSLLYPAAWLLPVATAAAFLTLGALTVGEAMRILKQLCLQPIAKAT